MKANFHLRELCALLLALPALVAAQVNLAPAFFTSTDFLAGHGNQARLQSLEKVEARLTAHFGNGRVVAIDAGVTGGQSISGIVGDAQGVSNIEAPGAVKIYNLFYEMPLGSNGNVRAGILDLNGIFYQQGRAAAIFLNSSHGVGPEFSHSGLNGPSIFPNSSLGVATEKNFGGATVRLGAFDAVPNDPAAPGRTALHLFNKGALLDAEVSSEKLSAGIWSYTSNFAKLDGSGNARGNSGVYATAQWLPSKSSAGWVTIGRSSATFNDINSYVGGGFAMLVDRYAVGVAVASAGFSDGRRRETNIEFAVPIQLKGGFSLQPDLQMIAHPSGGTGRAWVAGVQLHFVFEPPNRDVPFVRRKRADRLL
jgi:porin